MEALFAWIAYSPPHMYAAAVENPLMDHINKCSDSSSTISTAIIDQ